MTRRIQVAIAGYGNLGKGVEAAVSAAPDMTLAAIFTRRSPAEVAARTPNVPVLSLDQAKPMKSSIDVIIVCAGSATDLPEMTPALAADFTVVDSYDHHALIPDHFAKVDAAARRGGMLALIAVGWDPGIFSLNRLFASAVFPNGSDYTFWGKGVSQGHSDALRRVPGVRDARQYTIPRESALARVRSFENPVLSPREKHVRACFIVAEDGADRNEIERTVKSMPGYFAGYDTTVTFVTQEELDRDHRGMPHGGSVIRTGRTGPNRDHPYLIEYHVDMASNPEFTGAILTAYARAAVRMRERGERGCRTVFDVAPRELSAISDEELRETLL